MARRYINGRMVEIKDRNTEAVLDRISTQPATEAQRARLFELEMELERELPPTPDMTRAEAARLIRQYEARLRELRDQ